MVVVVLALSELCNDPVQSMLHTVRQIIILFACFVHTFGWLVGMIEIKHKQKKEQEEERTTERKKKGN